MHPSNCKSGGLVHPGIGRYDENARGIPPTATSTLRKPVPQRRKFVPTKKKNAQKNRFGEEGKTFQRKRIPMMPPALAIKLGQSKPSSKERTVPEIAHWLNPVAHAGGNV